MKRISTLAAFAALGLGVLSATAAGAVTLTPVHSIAPAGGVEEAQLTWRCGKNNPASWGTFGNGCLKQKRNWGKNNG